MKKKSSRFDEKMRDYVKNETGFHCPTRKKVIRKADRAKLRPIILRHWWIGGAWWAEIIGVGESVLNNILYYD